MAKINKDGEHIFIINKDKDPEELERKETVYTMIGNARVIRSGTTHRTRRRRSPEAAHLSCRTKI